MNAFSTLITVFALLASSVSIATASPVAQVLPLDTDTMDASGLGSGRWTPPKDSN